MGKLGLFCANISKALLMSLLLLPLSVNAESVEEQQAVLTDKLASIEQFKLENENLKTKLMMLEQQIQELNAKLEQLNKQTGTAAADPES